MLFKRYLNSLNKFQVFQLYTIIALAVLFPYFYFIDKNKNEKIYPNKNIMQVNKNIKDIKDKIVMIDNIKVLKELEKELIKYKTLSIQNFTLKKNSIHLNGISNQEEFFRFLIFCENYSVTSRLKSMALKNSEKKELFSFSLTIKFKNKYLSQISLKEKELLEKNILSLNKKKRNENKIILQAIFDKQIIINDKTFTIGDTLRKYTIEKIEKDHIVLIKDKSKKRLYIKGNINDL